MKQVLLSVSNDIGNDQRVIKMASTLKQMGFKVGVVGIRRKDSAPFSIQGIDIYRMPLLFQKGFLFYAELNIRLFFHLLINKADLLVSNDLDTLLPNHLVGRIKGIHIVYDTHEYFTGSPEVSGRPLVYRFWKSLEKWLFPKQKTIITVNNSIAHIYSKEYGKTLHVVRNLPVYKEFAGHIPRNSLGLPPLKDLIVLQGTGINTGRGAEELIRAMDLKHGLNHVVLMIIGGGNALPALKDLTGSLGLQNRVLFFNRMPYDEMMEYTRHARIGLSLDKDNSINHRYSLPNKIFDYMMAGTPQLVTDLPEVSNVVNIHNTGLIIKEVSPETIARGIQKMLSDKTQMKTWETNCLEAAKTLCWNKEKRVVEKIYAPFL